MLRPTVSSPLARLGAIFGKARKGFQLLKRRATYLSASRSFIFKQHPNIDQNLNTFGHFAKCRPMFANGSRFQPSTRASISSPEHVTASTGQSSQNFAASTTSRSPAKELGTFTSLAFNTCSNIALAVVAHTASKPVSKRHLMRNTTEIGLDRWQSLDQEAWSLIVGKLSGKSTSPKARSPRPHQSAAVSAAKTHFVRDGAARGRLIMPCGTGKSLTAYWIAEALKAKPR
jgi:hypothetical protein